jgi:Leucine-rich repeat (LRR) protein
MLQISAMRASFEEEMSALLDSVLSEDDIAAALGCNASGVDLDLSAVRRIRLCIDTNKKSVSELGRMLPCLEELVLDGSRIASIRDLGTDLRCLRILSLNDCGLLDLEGVSSLIGLEELYLRNNYINELVALTMHDNLKVIHDIPFKRLKIQILLISIF